MEKGQIDRWLQREETVAFLEALHRNFPRNWAASPNWEATCRLKGHNDVFGFINHWLESQGEDQ